MKKRDILMELNGKDYIETLKNDYDIRFCSEEEYSELVDFLKKYWKEDHIFVLSKELLDYQHLDKGNKRYNFVIAKHKESKEIHSILGFVPTNHFDKNVKSLNVWPCIWKSRDDIHRKGLGVALYNYLKNTLDIETISILGISEIALSIYKHWNFKTGHIEHYFMPNLEKEEYRLVEGFDKLERFDDKLKNVEVTIKKYTKENYNLLPNKHTIFENCSKYKTKQYYENRFFKHPVYKYDFLAIEKNAEPLAIMIVRECESEGSKCIRIVDFLGELSALKLVKEQLYDFLVQNEYEYIDFLEVGLDEKYLEQAGFMNKKKYEGVIVPNYFEPFLKKNIDLDYAYKTVNDVEEIIFYKADADQDRPNLLK